MQGFNQSDVKFVLALAEGLGKCPAHGRWFRNLKSIEIESADLENDTLLISECSIQKVEVDVKAIVPRKETKFKAFIPQYAPSTNYWEPDDVDIVEVGEFSSLAEAFSHFYVLEAETFTRDNAMATSYEEDKKVVEEV